MTAKLTRQDVWAIRREYAEGGVLERELADKYKVSRTTIGHIITRRNWKHI
jgi:DNA-binding FadR family transcriptional regulator